VKNETSQSPVDGASRPDSAEGGNPRRRKPKKRLWLRLCLVIVAVLGIAVWCGREPMAKLVEAAIVQRLNESGVYPKYASRSWSPWSGLHLEQLILYRNVAASEPIVEVSSLDVRFPWWRIWKAREWISDWHVHDAVVTLHDAKGAVTFKNVSCNVLLEGGEIDVLELRFKDGPIDAELLGQILFTFSQRPPEQPEEFVLDLEPIRAVRAALDIKPGSGPFYIHGKFFVDRRDARNSWEADLRGNGKQVVWRDIPLPDLDVQAHLSEKGMDISGNLHFTHGSGTLKASRKDWGNSPLVVSGEIADPAGTRDEVSASYNGELHTMMLASIRGKADLFAFGHSFPSLVRVLPSGITVRQFPELSLTKLVYREGKGSWTLESLELQSPAKISVMVGKQALAIDQLTGRASFDGREWHFSNVSGAAAGGQFTLAGSYAEGEARDMKLEINQWHLKDLKPWMGGSEGEFGGSILTMEYQGALGMQAAQWRGGGEIRLENAPVVKVPLLDETYALFAALSPSVKRSGNAEMKATFTVSRGVIEVSQFTATGEAVTVTGSGVVDLVRGQVDGRARGNLRGVAGVATSVFSKALEMKVSGPLDHIRVQPIGPVDILGKAAVGVAELPGKVLKEGVAVPAKIFDWLGGKPSAPASKP
jgi:hypothetical protein